MAPILPCDPENLARLAPAATDRHIIGDPFHVPAAKQRGATTREQALRVSGYHGYTEWHDPGIHEQVQRRIRRTVEAAGRRFAVGPEGFGWLARV